ncbi:60S ribosomal protein L13 [Cymbomonas tetramitiformis]|uniref:60S ribosomal protein L13 n=1 Tax=Cymbomonas tetramitiformis TaxID=36881 RepID=A0AAE0EQE8_9CHLO|nr:60S ribosomal protein L13 [Cymbomonas tetramitiformis]
MVRHNNEIPHQHFKKDWQERVKTWFEQPARKQRRRLARAAKAKSTFPRPTAGALRPLVHCQSIRYNSKVRAGRGFTFEELKEAGIPVKMAPTIGICVDHRRHNKSLESLQENVKRLKAYKAKLLLFPRNLKKPKNGDSTAEELQTADQLAGVILPTTKAAPAVEFVALTEEQKNAPAYAKLRLERMNARMIGIRKKRAEEAEKEAKDAAKGK